MTVADFNMTLTYRPGTANVVADALSRKQEELKTQKDKDKAARTRAFLSAKQININVIQAACSHLAELATQGLITVNAIEIAATNTFIASPSVDNPHSLINRIIELNRTHDSLQPFREKALAGKATWQLDAQGLLTH
jgi:hypothetical protein